MKIEMPIRIDGNNSILEVDSNDIEELPCVKCLMRPICSNTPDHLIKCNILAEFIQKYSISVGIDIELIDLVAAPLQKQLLYIYNKINNGS